MLKVTFTETGSHLEHLTQPLEEWIGLRVLLALTTAQRLIVEPTTASILLRSDLADLETLETLIHQDPETPIALCHCDSDYLEASLKGTWVTSGSPEGVFIALLPLPLETLLLELWQKSQACPTTLWR